MKRYIRSSLSDYAKLSDYEKMLQSNEDTPLTDEERAQGYSSAKPQFDRPLDFSKEYLANYKNYLKKELDNYNSEIAKYHVDPIDIHGFSISYEFTFRNLDAEFYDNQRGFIISFRFKQLVGLRDSIDVNNLDNAVKQDAKFIYEEIIRKYGGQIKFDLYGE